MFTITCCLVVGLGLGLGLGLWLEKERKVDLYSVYRQSLDH